MNNSENGRAKYYPFISRENLISYCEIHRKTPRGLFRKDQIAQMIEYAGCPEEFPSPKEMAESERRWYPMPGKMSKLVNLARKNNSK